MSPDGRTLLLRVNGGKVIQDIWYRQVTGDTTAKPLITSPAFETGARFSPDGHWVVYSSDESATRQVYVTPFPGPGARFQVSVDGGQEPIWSRDGHRIFYVNGRTMMAATVAVTPSFSVTSRVALFTGNFVFQNVHANYDVSPDGTEFLLLKEGGAESQTIVIHDWRTELRARTAVAGKK